MDSETLTQKRNVKIIFTLSVIVFIGIIGFTAYTLIGRIGKVAVNVKYAPYVAEVSVDDKKLKNNAVNYLEPGEYTIKVSYDGFNPLEDQVIITTDTKNLYGMLNANSPEGEATAKKYQNDFLDVQSIYGQESIAEGEQQRQEWPILNFLPITNALYSLGYTMDSNNQPIITVRTTTTYLDSVIAELIGLAKAPQTIATYNVKINDYTNIFNKVNDNSNPNPVAYLKTIYADIPELTVNPGTTNGDYFYTTISAGDIETYNLVTYRVVLHKNGSSWQLSSTPYPVLTTTNTPNVPLDILNAVNAL